MKKITAVLLALAIILSLAACGKAQDPASVVMIKNFCEGLKLFDKEKMASCFEDDRFAEDIESLDDEFGGEAIGELIRTLAADITYNITSAEENGDSADIAVAFNHADASPLYTAVMNEYMTRLLGLMFTEGSTEEQVGELLGEILKDKSAEIKPETMTTTVNFHCIQKDGKWLIGDPLDKNFLNVITFNMIKSLEDFADSLTN